MRIQSPQAGHFLDLFPRSVVAIPHQKTWRHFSYLARFRVKQHVPFSRLQGCLALSKRRLGTLSECLKQAVTNDAVGGHLTTDCFRARERASGHMAISAAEAVELILGGLLRRPQPVTPYATGASTARARALPDNLLNGILSIHPASGWSRSVLAIAISLMV